MPRLSKADWQAVRGRYEATLDPLRDIAEAFGTNVAALSAQAKRGGWLRPGATPGPPVEGDDGKLLGRLFRAFERQVTDLEQRFAAGGGSVEEKDARTLAVLAKTFETLSKLRDERGEDVDAGAVDLGELRARLAQRLAALSPDGHPGVDALGDAGGGDDAARAGALQP
ncbi:hypothetical protein OSH08_09375 [Kaistia geumhonensis]|uniref:Uncharacterized protein n=1 Tax=Kaistia geumhonensis TaxID=410839 RepID=A0ABU0M3P7_9HYPH|nr:hypothetical protein [Kaistia geumhonensis]MCX5479214.1 hypothetical protein [Kaistia geumhonensis]MDQ0515566.1 hypothetical protein [Kaistia geumhonensis]